MAKTGLTYEDTGVSISAGEKLVNLIKDKVVATHSSRVLAGVGAFASLSRVPMTDDVISVKTIDGIGTRIEIGILTNNHEASGAALVAHCINDCAVVGGKPDSFLDYYGVSKLDPEIASRIILGAAAECKKYGVSLEGGETAEMPGFYVEGKYDFVGTIFGYARESQLVLGQKNVAPGDILIGLQSDGLQTNGYSHVRGLIDREGLTVNDLLPWGISIGDELSKPHRCYVRALQSITVPYGTGGHKLQGAAHITGGGIPGNLIRILPDGCRAFIDPSSWEVLPIFNWIRELSGQPLEDWRTTYNLGIGVILAVRFRNVDEVREKAEKAGERTFIIGDVREGECGVEFLD